MRVPEDLSQSSLYLASSEGYSLERPRHIDPIRRVGVGDEDAGLLAAIAPAIDPADFDLPGGEIGYVVLVPRHMGVSFDAINRWPVYVHVARPSGGELDRDHFAVTELEVLA